MAVISGPGGGPTTNQNWTFTGQILDGDGTPDENDDVEIGVWFVNVGNSRSFETLSGTTDSSGNYSLSQIGGWPASLSVSVPGQPIVQPGGGQIAAIVGANVRIAPVFVGLGALSYQWTLQCNIKDVNNLNQSLKNYPLLCAFGFHNINTKVQKYEYQKTFSSDANGKINNVIAIGPKIPPIQSLALDYAALACGIAADNWTGGGNYINTPGDPVLLNTFPTGSVVGLSDMLVTRYAP
jgi:hypothetical protein